METIIVTGGTGLIGRQLCRKLKAEGYDVAILSRSKRQDPETKSYFWDWTKMEIEAEAIDKADYIIHLAGENIMAKRWSPEQKKLIIDSRVKTGELIFDTIQKRNKKLKAFISASAIGYYGAVMSEKIFTESDPPAGDFVGDTCRLWEQMADRFGNAGTRTVKVRTSPVLAKEGGVLRQMVKPVKMGIGSAIGTGQQYLPWIHIDDLCRIYVKAIADEKMSGAYNAAAPDHKTNEEFMRTLADVLQKPFWFPKIPAFMVKLVFGEMGTAVLQGSRISSEKIRSAGYNFLFADLRKALMDILKDQSSPGSRRSK